MSIDTPENKKFIADWKAYAKAKNLPDAEKRKELMIIYAEDLALTGFTLADLRTDGKAADQRPRIEREVLARALERLTGR